MQPIHITTERLLIRPLSLSDLAGFHQYRSNPEVTRYQGFDVMTMDDAASFIEGNSGKSFGNPGEWVQYAIADAGSNQLIGDCAIQLHAAHPGIVSIGITISPLEQRKGYAKEALRGILRFLFEEKQLHRVEEIVDAENTASIQLLRSLGFREEGHFIENIFFKGKWGSEYQFALLRREWLSRS